LQKSWLGAFLRPPFSPALRRQVVQVRTKENKGPGSLSVLINSPFLHIVLYSMLLVLTPFVLLQSFMVEMIGKVSAYRIGIAGLRVPVTLLTALVVAAFLLICFRPRLTRLRIAAVVIVLLLDGLAQQITDYYFGQHFYDLMQNWHYVAYGLFAFVFYRYLDRRGTPLVKSMLLIYWTALALSAFDETFQKYMSARIFDICDIAKDSWGTLMGMILLFMGGSRAQALLADWKRIRHPRLRGYVEHPFTLLLLMTVLSFLWVTFSSLLTEVEYAPTAVAVTVGSFLLFFVILHASQFKWGKYTLLTVFGICLVVQIFYFVRYRSENIVHNQFGLTVYKGIPLVFFDAIIFPDGTFRPVDKKHYFNSRDQRFLLRWKPDILVIGSGAYGKGGNGFFEKSVVQFIYNDFIGRGTQVIILPTPQACLEFNRLKQERKSVLFVIHNTC
jgi:VanZ family protein